jgi:hypothetical protein
MSEQITISKQKLDHLKRCLSEANRIFKSLDLQQGEPTKLSKREQLEIKYKQKLNQ